MGFQDCTPVQEQTMPSVLEGKDVAGLAQTGTGKTAAFLLPLMERILRAGAVKRGEEMAPELAARAFPDWAPMNFILVLVPTRELAEQVYENAVKFGGAAGLRAVSVYGGVGYDKQKDGLRGGAEFVIATPGRLIDLFKENVVDMKQVRAIVFDEADRMFDMGFKDDMKYILTRVPKERQFMVFSATLNLDVMNTAYQFGANPVEFNVSRDQAKAENVEDKIFHIGQEEKGAHLLALLKLHNPRQVIVFSNFKMNVPRISDFLNNNGFPAVGISSLLTQSQRTRVMEQFKGDSDKNIMVATDVAARGLDIKGVDMVVNFELPDDPENYVHRIGRTGRAGAKGIAFSLVSDRDVDALSRVEGYLKHKVPVDFIDEALLPKEFKAMSDDRHGKDFSREFEGRGPRPSRGGGPASGGRPNRGGGSGGGDRGPRRGGQGGEGERPRRGDRRDRRDQREGKGPQAAGEAKPQTPLTHGPGPAPAPGAAHGGGPRKHAGGGPGGKRHGGEHRKHGGANGSDKRGPKPHGGHKHGHKHGGPSHPGKPGAKGSIGQKVSGFFKRLFGA
ncbi:MAG: DEAD/DEAH box helicase [Bdellovibrionaceae bacterium]|nr:DEAD/DEAH box helicase [Pseudobdellovibrionaceae bacterium]